MCYFGTDIEGSCIDNRSGTKSVFFTDEKIIFGELVLKLISIPICKMIIKKMPFEIEWKLNKEYNEKLKSIF